MIFFNKRMFSIIYKSDDSKYIEEVYKHSSNIMEWIYVVALILILLLFLASIIVLLYYGVTKDSAINVMFFEKVFFSTLSAVIGYIIGYNKNK